MSEPLTEHELSRLESLPEKYYANARHLIEKAAAEIRELRKEKVEFIRGVVGLQVTIDTVEADNAKLRERLKKYGRHKNRCGWADFAACDCGLDDLLKENDDE